MEILKAFCIAFSIYSKVPVPQFKWDEKDMRYHLIFFPFVGALTGGLLILWNYICCVCDIGKITYICIGTAIPLIVTGGFHVDGFMDTMDALKSYKSKEEKLEIMKDAHIGAFSIIMLVSWGLVYIGAYSLLTSFFMRGRYIGIFACIFFLSRVLSAIAVLSFRNAKDEGMLHTFSDSASSRKGFVRFILLAELLVCVGFMLIQDILLGGILFVVSLLYLLYYWWKTRKEFGGITGDTAGYFVVCLEVILTVVMSVYGVII